MKHGIIAFLDALGVKGIWARSKPEDVIKAWSDTLAIFKLAIEKVTDVSPREKFHILAFSDTIIILLETEKDAISSLPLMAEILLVPFNTALIDGIFFRGAVSIGEFEFSESMIIGPAVDEVAEWYTIAEWIGISLCPSASFGVSRLLEQGADVSKWFVKYDIPMKSGVDGKDEWALSWPRLHKDIALGNGKTLSAKAVLLNAFAKNGINVLAYPKYKNTLCFFDYIKGNNAQHTPANAEKTASLS
jgi:hypothetical protein